MTEPHASENATFPADSGAPALRAPDRGRAVANEAVRFVGVNKSFDGAVVLEDLTIDFERGKTTVVLGPSGSGKSVLLRHIVGLLTPARGEVHFEGHRVDTMKERELRRLRERVGFLFQLSALFDSMTVQENLEFPLRERTKMRRQERLDRVRENLRRVDLSGAERKMPSELSGGQQKRAALARALMLEPEVMLYDEPTTGLDPIRASEIDALINKMKAELGVTGIVVTHDLASAEHVGDRIVLLDGGHVLADGTMDELRRSDVPRVQAFLTGDGARLVPGSERDPGEPSKAAGGSSFADDRAAVERGAVHHSDAKAGASNDTGETSTEHDA